MKKNIRNRDYYNMGNRTKKLQTRNWFRSIKKQHPWEQVRSDKAIETMESLNETNQIDELVYNINNTPDGIIRILRK